MISVELLQCLSIKHRLVIALASLLEPSWMDPFVSFLVDGSLPTNVKEAEKLRRMSSHFLLSKDKKQYQQSFGGPYLLCLLLNEVARLLAELHEGICGSHSRGRSLSHRVMT